MFRQHHRLPNTIFERAVFVDTSALYALADERDTHHRPATSCLEQIRKNSLPIYISNVTIFETYRLILYKLGIRPALFFLKNMYDESILIERIIAGDEQEARGYLNRFSTKDISYVDAINSAVMKRIGIFKAFAFDWHYGTLGFSTIPPFYV